MYHSGWAPCGTKVDTSSVSRKAGKPARSVFVQFVTLVTQLVRSKNSGYSDCNFLTSQAFSWLQSTSFCPQFWAHRHLYLEIDDGVGAPLSALSLAPGRSDSSAFLGSSRVDTLHIHNGQYA